MSTAFFTLSKKTKRGKDWVIVVGSKDDLYKIVFGRDGGKPKSRSRYGSPLANDVLVDKFLYRARRAGWKLVGEAKELTEKPTCVRCGKPAGSPAHPRHCTKCWMDNSVGQMLKNALNPAKIEGDVAAAAKVAAGAAPLPPAPKQAPVSAPIPKPAPAAEKKPEDPKKDRFELIELE